MQIQFSVVLWSLAGLIAGGLIGLAFGLIQDTALRRHQRAEDGGKFNNGWALMPGSMRRVGGLVMVLALVQIVCPLLFANGVQWWVSGGIVAGYGGILFRQLRQKLARNR